MPLHIDIRLNHELLTQVHIGRVHGGTSPDEINTYRAVETAPNAVVNFWAEESVEFIHRYGDGALTCTYKALEALHIPLPINAMGNPSV